ncbi:MAG: hypothetical protein R2788_16960 [Saprospiraceae bacterium]
MARTAVCLKAIFEVGLVCNKKAKWLEECGSVVYRGAGKSGT